MTKRILFVDDDPDFTRSLERLLVRKRPEWALSIVHNVDSALAHLAESSFDTVVSDISMPEKDGFALLHEVRKTPDWSEIPFVMITGRGESTLKRRALMEGATDLINKPFDIEELVARIQNCLRLKAYEDDLKTQNVALEDRVRRRTAELEESRKQIILHLAKVGEYRDDITGNHVVRVGYYCRILSERLGMPRDFVQCIYLTSPLHDIGKVAIPDAVLLKAGALTPEERASMQRHCHIGAEILSHDMAGASSLLLRDIAPTFAAGVHVKNPLLDMAHRIALSHHERWDGSGYPNGLIGEAIPLEGRIAALADVYDALSSARPYKAAFPEDKVLAIMREERGRHFEPGLFDIFEQVLDDIRAVRLELTDTFTPAGS